MWWLRLGDALWHQSCVCVCVSGGSFLLVHTRCNMFELVCLLTITDLIYKTDHFKCKRFWFKKRHSQLCTSQQPTPPWQQDPSSSIGASSSPSLPHSVRVWGYWWNKDASSTPGGSRSTQFRKTPSIHTSLLLWSVHQLDQIKGKGEVEGMHNTNMDGIYVYILHNCI